MPEITLTVSEKLAESLKAVEQPLEADTYIVLQLLNWNIHERAGGIVKEIEREAPSYSRIADLAGQSRALAAACDEIERDELPATYPRPVEEAR